MSRSLRKLIDGYLKKEGQAGKAMLCLSLGKSERTLLRWLAKGIPTEREAYYLAKACGAEEQEALALARESFRPVRKAAG